MTLLSYVAGHSQAGGEAAGGVVGVFGGLVIRVGNYVIDVRSRASNQCGFPVLCQTSNLG